MTAANKVDIISNVPVLQDIIFTNDKGEAHPSTEKKQRKFLKEMGPHLRIFLKPDEAVWFISPCYAPMSLVERLIGGNAAILLKRSFVVFTNQRMLHVPLTPFGKFRNSMARVLYSDCRSIVAKRLGLDIEYKDGKKERFSGVLLPKKINKYFEQHPFDSSAAANPKRIYMCPRCTHELEPKIYKCKACHLGFKDQKTALRMALIFPGGGYFYLRRPLMGVGDALVEAFLMLLLVGCVLSVMDQEKDGWSTLIVVSICLIVEKLISVFHSNHFVSEWVPADKGPIATVK